MVAEHQTSKERVAELPAELRRFAKGCESGYWTGVFDAAADEIEAARAALEPSDASVAVAMQWVDIATTMLHELRQDYAPGELKDTDGVKAIRALRARTAPPPPAEQRYENFDREGYGLTTERRRQMGSGESDG